MAEPPAEVAQVRGSLVKVNIGGRTYDAAKYPQCHTCTHPARVEIEQRLLAGHGYREVAAQYSGTEYTVAGETRVFPEVAWSSIYTHFRKGHMPVEAAALRQIMDDRSRELSDHYDEETTKLVDGHSFARQVLQMTQQALLAGEIKPDVHDGLAAARLLKDMESELDNNIDAEVWSQAMTVYFETAQKIMPPEMWTQFVGMLEKNPVLASLRRRLESGPEDETIDAEVVEEGATP
jgi:hypothetical protein